MFALGVLLGFLLGVLARGVTWSRRQDTLTRLDAMRHFSQ